MKRFYCTICGRIKRTQKWPTILEQMDAAYPENRLGECNWHREGIRVPLRVRSIRPAKAVKVVAVKQSRKRA